MAKITPNKGKDVKKAKKDIKKTVRFPTMQ
jgi:hypothetical protein